MNNALPALNAKEDKHNVFNDGKDQTIRYVEWKDEMKTKARSCAKHHGIKVLMGDSVCRVILQLSFPGSPKWRLVCRNTREMGVARCAKSDGSFCAIMRSR